MDRDGDADGDAGGDTDGDTDTDTDMDTVPIGTLTIQEGEGFCRVDGDIETEHWGYEGDGYANSLNQSGAAVIWGVYAEVSWWADLVFRYATIDDRIVDIFVNGELVADNQSFPATGAWTTWSTVGATVVLPAGENFIRVVAVSVDGNEITFMTDLPFGTDASGGVAIYDSSGTPLDFIRWGGGLRPTLRRPSPGKTRPRPSPPRCSG